MSEATLLIKAYYEVLYERLEANRQRLKTAIERLLKEEAARGVLGKFGKDKYSAYCDASLAFVDERLEMYNPIGAQYTFDRSRAKEAFELGLQLDWYDSRAEWEALTAAAKEKAEFGINEERMHELVEELIQEQGAYPDRSIISGYETQVSLGKLPDYVVARAIEEVIR